MKKIILSLLALMMTMGVNAQYQTESTTPFEQGKVYLSAAVSNLDFNFTGAEKWKLDAQLKAGYLFMDNWMLLANGEFDYRKYAPNTLKLGAGLRYYIEQNGLFLGAGVNYLHSCGNDDVMPAVSVGYAFFLSRTVTLEPELYYNQSLKNHSDYSGAGFRLGLGIYLDDIL